MARNSLFATLAVLILFACDAEDDSVQLRSHESYGYHDHHDDSDDIFPGVQWQVGEPEDHGLSSEGLDDMATIAEQVNSACVVVIQDGVLVGEWYWDGFDAETPIPDVWSATKSMTSAVVGIAEDQDLLDIHDPASLYIPQWQGTDSEDVTIFDLITQTSGREWDFYSDIAILQQADQTAYALGFGQEREPGTRWDYSNLGTQSLEAVLENAISGDVEDYFQAKLFEPIGMNARMARDSSGNPLVYTGISATCRDLARFGYLYLRKGRWQGKQIVPKSWVAESTQTSTDLNDAYGYLWWLNTPGHVVLSAAPVRPEFDGKFFPSAPDEMYMAAGAFGQFITIDPKDEIVVVRTTLSYDMSNPYGMGDMDAILGAIEAAKIDDCE